MSMGADHEEDDMPGWLQLVLLPFLLIEAIRQVFAGQTDQRRQKRRTHQLPPDWQDFIPKLRQAEWPTFVLKAEGARRILKNEPLDLDAILITAPAPNQLWIPPTSAQQMHLRILALARFHAAPSSSSAAPPSRAQQQQQQQQRQRRQQSAYGMSGAGQPRLHRPEQQQQYSYRLCVVAPACASAPLPGCSDCRLPTAHCLSAHAAEAAAACSRNPLRPPSAAKSLSTGASFRRVPLSNRRHNESAGGVADEPPRPM